MSICENCKREVDYTEGVFVAHGELKGRLLWDESLRLCPQCEHAVLQGVDTVLHTMATVLSPVKDR